MATAGETTIAKSGLDPITLRTLNAFRRRRGVLLVLRSIGVGLLVFISLALTLATMDYLFFFSDLVRWCLSLAIYLATGIAVWLTGLAPLRHRDELEIARHVESVAPTLREDLVSAVELADPNSTNGSVYFRRILQSRVARRIAKVDVGKVLPIRLVRRWLLSGGAVAACCIALMFIPSAQFGRRLARAALPGFAIERASRTKITILKPDPASRNVAERDAVGVIAQIQGADPDDVMLHWRSADGTSGESVMTPRMDAASFQPGQTLSPSVGVDSTDTDRRGGRFAANLSVGSRSIQYRITAGDAITLWHELTPMPRPRVTRFEKLYRLPSYAKLDDRSADEEHGDLKALQGTTAEVTVTFDQPVENPVIRFGVRGARNEMEPTDESGTKFLARISIKTSGQYQVDAMSARSGLNNPFSPTNMITPVLDTPPVVRWSEELKPNQLVSALDVIELAAFAADDLPLEKVLQEVQVNDQRFKSYALPIDTPDRKIDFAWSWDMIHRLGDSSPAEKLAAGDLVRTRLVAIDRRGTRTESKLIEFLIAGDGFDAQRHQFLQPLAEQATQTIEWANQSQELAKQLKAISKSGQFDELPALNETWKTLQSASVELIKSVTDTLSQTQNTASASMTELVGRSILDVETRLDGQIKQMDWLSQSDQKRWEKDQKRALNEVGKQADQTAYQCERLSEFAQARFSLGLSASLYSDVSSLRDSVDRLAEKMPKQRLPRYLTLMAGQIADIDRLIAQYESLLSRQTLQHLSGDHWLRWSQRWKIQLETLLEDEASRDQVAAVIRSLRDQIQDKPQHVIHNSIHSTALRWGRDLRKEVLYLSDLTRRLRDAGTQWERAKKAAERDRNVEDAIESGLSVRWRELQWQTELNRLVVRAAGQEKLNRAKSKVDLNYAADQNLFLRAIKNVTSSGYQAYREEPAERVFGSIGGAIGVLQATSDLAASRDDFLAIREGERQHDASPLRKIYHPIWFELQETRIELGVRYLRQSDADSQQFLQRIDATRNNDQHEKAKSRLDSRQWRSDPFISAGKPLESMAQDLQAGLDGLAAKQEEARDVLRRYVLKLSEQAREASEAAKQAQQETDERSDATEESAEQLEPKQQDAVEKATETIGALIDQANTSDIVDQEQREIARDADAAAELIAEAVQQTKKAIKQSEASTSVEQRDDAMEAVELELEKLSERLGETADHFEKIENGEDVSQSREKLREAEELSNAAATLDERYDSAEEMADAAKQDPRELLRQLEQELKRNEPMQESLSDISAELVHDAAKNLELAAKEEDSLQRRLETEDDAFAEQKLQKRLMIDEFIERAKTLRDKTLSTTSQASGWANEPELSEQIAEIREQITESIGRAERATERESTLSEIRSATKRMQEDFKQAALATEQVAERMNESGEKDLHGDPMKRKTTASSMNTNANRLRNDEVHALDRQRQKWMSAEKAAGGRIKNAEERKRQAENALSRLQKQMEKKPGDDGLMREVDKQQDRRDEASRNVQQTRLTKELARERRDQATRRTNEINESKAAPLDKPNPAAQLGENLARGAARQMEQLSKELEQLNGEADVASDLRATTESAQQLSKQQQSVESDVQSAVEDLARAARHESRLDNETLAEQLATVSEQTRENAGQVAEAAGDALDEAAGAGDQSAEASRTLQEASDAIAKQAEEVGNLLGQGQSAATAEEPSEANSPSSPSQQSSPAQQSSPSQQAQPSQAASADATQSPSQTSGQQASGQQPGASQQPSGDSPSPQQMAQTLDELDRSLASKASGQPSNSQNAPSDAAPDGQGQPSNQSQPGQPGQGQPQDGPSGQAQSDSGGPPKNAIEASPTLAQMLEAQMQQAARERMQSLQQAQAGESPGDQSSDASSPNPVSESGDGEQPDGPQNVDLLSGDIADGEWGELRRRGVDDAAQGRGARIPPGYAREIKAYFKAISKRATESK